MDRVGGVLPIKLRSEKTMQSKSGGEDEEEREREKCGYSLRQRDDQSDEGASSCLTPRAKDVSGSLKLAQQFRVVQEKGNRKIRRQNKSFKL